MMDLKEVGAAITHMKVCVARRPSHAAGGSAMEVADLVRQALKVIPAERLVLSSDCGMGREGTGAGGTTRWCRWCRARISSEKSWLARR
jgi:hypothetical protein